MENNTGAKINSDHYPIIAHIQVRLRANPKHKKFGGKAQTKFNSNYCEK